MPHPLVLAVYADPASAARAGRALRDVGFEPDRVSIVARSHQDEGEIAEAVGASPGAEIEDSRPAARVAELGAFVLAAIALVMPGVGPTVAAGPLAAEFGEAAGHVAGGIASVLEKAGLSDAQAADWQRRIEAGAILLGVHVIDKVPATVELLLRQTGASDIVTTTWPGEDRVH